MRAFSGRMLFWVFYPLLQAYVRLNPRPRTRVLVTDGRGKVLLMRGWFGRQRWDLPGGGIKRGEPAAAAAAREVLEETGVALRPDELRLVGEFDAKAANLVHGVILFHARATSGPVRPDARHALEVLEAKWWPMSRLPNRINMFAVKALRKLEEVES